MNADPADRLGMQLKLFRSRPAATVQWPFSGAAANSCML